MPRSAAKPAPIGPGHNQPPEPLPDPFDGRLTISIDETAVALGIGRDTIYAMLQDGRLIASKFGKRTAIHTVSIRRLMEATKLRLRPRAKTLRRAEKRAAAAQAAAATPT